MRDCAVEIAELTEDDGMSASLAQAAVGDYRDAETVLAFAQTVDAITFDHEHVPQPVLRALVDAGVSLALVLLLVGALVDTWAVARFSASAQVPVLGTVAGGLMTLAGLLLVGAAIVLKSLSMLLRHRK